MHILCLMWFYAVRFVTCKKIVCVPSVCYISNDYLQNCVYLYSVPLLQHSIGSLFADVADFCDKCLSVVKSSWPRG